MTDPRPTPEAPRPVVTVVGSVNMDLVVRVPRHPAPGETIIGSDYVTHPGGKGANQAVAAARQGAEVRFMGRVGDDGFGAELRAALVGDGVDVSALGTSRGPSGVAFIQVDERGQNSITVSPGANYALTVADLPEAAFQGADVLLLQLEVDLQVVLAAARRARQAGALVVLNLAPAQRLSAEPLRDVTHLVVNEHEAALLMGATSLAVVNAPEHAARELTALVPNVVVTLGDAGAVWAERRGDEVVAGRVPAFAVNAVDTTAAGDAFTGAFAVRLAAGAAAAAAAAPTADAPAATLPSAGAATGTAAGAMAEVVRYACAAGALATTRPGAQPSLPRAADVERLLREGAP